MIPDFAEPGPWHRPATYWFWHRLPEREEIRSQIRQMRDGGFSSFAIQARMAYPLDGYLDDAFLDAYRFAVDVAAEHGMVVGLYDDYCWQSGHAGGRAVHGHDELRERHLFWSPVVDGRATVSGIRSATENLGPAAMAWHYEGARPEWTDWRIEYVLDGVADRPDLASIVTADADGCVVECDEAATVFVSARCVTSRLVNVVDRDAVARFVEAGYQPFADRLGAHLGSTVAYSFFDQPHAIYYDWAERHGDVRSSMPFHESLDRAIRATWSDYPAVLAALLDASDADTLALRAAFYELYGTHAREAFLGTVSQWSQEHGLLRSGHEVLSHVGSWHLGDAFDNYDLRLNFGLDHFAVDDYRDLTAVDAQDGVAQLSPKLGDGVARHHGRTGTLVEQYFMVPPPGGAPWSGHWGLTLQELRATAIRHHMQGMRQLIFHGFYQTDGHDRDHESLVNPRFDFPPGINFEPWFAEHHAAFATETGRLSAFLDGISPAPDVALLYPLRTLWTHGQVGKHAEHLGGWAQALTASGHEFDIVDERDLATVDTVLARGYSAVVLPNVEALASRATVAVLAQLQARGVRVVASGRTPWIYQSGAQTAADDWAALNAPAAAAPSTDLLDPPRAELTSGAPDLWLRSGTAPDGSSRIAVFNDGAEAATVQLPAGAVQEWSAESGERFDLPGGTEVMIGPNELRLFVTGTAVLGRSAATEAVWGPPRELRDGWTLDGRPVRVDSGWEQQGFPDSTSVATYRAALPADGRLLTLPAVAGSVRVFVDGQLVGSRGWAPYRFRVPSGEVLQIEVAAPAANRYYAGTGLRAGPEPAGLLAPPVLQG